MRRFLPLAALVLLGLVAASAGPHAEAAPPPAWDYVLRFDEDLAKAHVSVCFRRYTPKRLVTKAPETLDAVTLHEDATHARMSKRASDGSLFVHGMRRGRMCLQWTVDLRRAEQHSSRWEPAARRVGRDLVLAPGAVLFRPYLWPLDAQVTVRIETPEGVRVAVPWAAARAPNTYVLDPHATRLMGRIAVGRFTLDRATIPGAEVRIAVLDAPHKASAAGIRRWILDAANAVGGLYGRFPSPRLLAIVQPVPGRDPPVVFGISLRAGGGHVHLLLSNAAPDDALPGEWVAVHELMHIGMPWTHESDAWLQEGFVTYYQEVLRARAGMLSERRAWQNIHEGFGRGRRRGGQDSLEAESRGMHRSHLYHRVYWAGAAMALLIDVELRKRSKGKQSLDDVLRWWRTHRGGSDDPHRGVDLMRAVDRALGGPMCSQITETCLANKAFPDVEGAFEALGVVVKGGRVALDDAAPLAAHRRAIMAASSNPVARPAKKR